MKKLLVLAGGDGSEREVSIASGRRVAEAFCRLGFKTALIDPAREVNTEGAHFFTDFDALKNSSSLFAESKESGYVFLGKGENKSTRSRFSDFGEAENKETFFSNTKETDDTETVFLNTKETDDTEAPFSKAFESENKSSYFYGFEETGGSEKQRRAFITDSVISLCREADAVFICLHGGIGENGRLAALFECLGIKYFGSSPEGAADAMDKLRSKRIFESVGIPTPLYTVYSKNQKKPPMPPRFPCVVKPTREGSSVGVTVVKSPGELNLAVAAALESSETVLMEAEIRGREITVGILDERALAVTEIIPKDGFYDYESKYTAGKTVEITPAEIPQELTERAMRLAERTHKALGLSGFSRIDMMIENKTNLIYVLEANSIPGMTCTSLLPLAAEYRGIDFTELCRRMAR